MTSNIRSSIRGISDVHHSSIPRGGCSLYDDKKLSITALSQIFSDWLMVQTTLWSGMKLELFAGISAARTECVTVRSA